MLQDLRFAVRQLLRSPGFTAVTVLTLALGLSVNAMLFNIANDLFFRPLPAQAPDRLVVVAQKAPAIDFQIPISYPDYEDLNRLVETGASDLARVYTGLMAYKETPVHLSRTGVVTERTWIHAVSSNYFTVLGVQPQLGRFFLPGEGLAPGADPIVILSDASWRNHFNADPTIVGQTIKINGLPITVVGVAPVGVFGASWGTALSGFVPITMLPRLSPGGEKYVLNRGNTAVFLMGRLGPEVTLAQAQAATSVAFAQIVRDNPDNFLPGSRAIVMRESNSRPSPYVAHYTPKILAALSAMALLVLVVAIANVTNLLYARAAARERELAIRSAIGAGRWRLIRSLLTESAVLAVVAGVLGAFASLWLTPLLISLAPVSASSAPAAAVATDWRPLLATVVAALGVGLVAGLLPALKASGFAPLPFLKEAAPSTTGTRHRLRSLLVIGQVAVSCVVLVVAALALRSLVLLSHLDLGYQADHVVMGSFDLGLQNYTPEQGRQFHAQLLEKLRALPDVQSASLGTNTPLDTRINQLGGISAPGAPEAQDPKAPPVACIQVDHNYLATLGLRVEAGRHFTGHDDANAPRVAIINHALAQRLWPKQNPVGRRISIQSREAEVVGLIGQPRFYSLRNDAQPLLVTPLAQNYRGSATLVIRTSGPTAPLLSALSKVVRELDPDLPLADIHTLQEQIAESPSGLMPYRFGALLVGAQGAIALLLAGAGLFGLIAFAVTRRTREIGIRMALGASRTEIVRSVTRESLVLTLVGLALGAALSLVLARGLSSLLYGAGQGDFAILAGVALIIGFAAAAACWIPVRRAMRINPVEAVRAD